MKKWKIVDVMEFNPDENNNTREFYMLKIYSMQKTSDLSLMRNIPTYDLEKISEFKIINAISFGMSKFLFRNISYSACDKLRPNFFFKDVHICTDILT
jgi:hypothetical protein